MKKIFIMMFCAFGLILIVNAEDKKPDKFIDIYALTPRMKSARKIYQNQLDTAQSIYSREERLIAAKKRNSTKTANNKLIEVLNKEFRRLVESKKLNEALAVQQEIKKIKDGNKATEIKTDNPKKVIKIFPKDFQLSGITVKKGQIISIKAEGKWVLNPKFNPGGLHGPEGHPKRLSHSTGPTYYLEVGIGLDKMPIGSGRVIIANTNGEMKFRIRASGPEFKNLKDKAKGSIKVTIELLDSIKSR